jgi:hypothetical protein
MHTNCAVIPPTPTSLPQVHAAVQLTLTSLNLCGSTKSPPPPHTRPPTQGHVVLQLTVSPLSLCGATRSPPTHPPPNPGECCDAPHRQSFEPVWLHKIGVFILALKLFLQGTETANNKTTNDAVHCSVVPYKFELLN